MDRKAGLEAVMLDGEQQIVGRDPRRMTQAELRALGHEAKPVLRVIRERCLDCCGGSESEVRRCVAIECVSWPYRMGKNPWREGREISKEERERMAARLAKGRASRSRDLATNN